MHDSFFQEGEKEDIYVRDRMQSQCSSNYSRKSHVSTCFPNMIGWILCDASTCASNNAVNRALI